MGKENKKIYYAAVFPDENNSYMIEIVDFPELAPDFGATFDEAVLSASQFLDDVVSEYVETGKALPQPHTPEEVKAQLGEAAQNLLCLVPITVYPPARTIRVNITGKEDVFARIDLFAKRQHFSRSDLMLTATMQYIEAHS